ncbi:MAG: hypothetical protein LUF04_03300, partial [Bacteroides sp.]|nr:hypothetical protein [Bacteroides sp.]
MVSQLENQYLIKVLKPEYRITLSTLLKKINQRIKRFEVKTGSDQEERHVSVKEYYVDSLQSLGISSYMATETYFPYMASMPIRSQVSLMKAFEDYKVKGEKEYFIQNIMDIFYTDLKTSKVEVWDLANGIGFINVHILKFLLDNNILDEGSQLLPKIENDVINGALIALGILWQDRVTRKPSEIFDYMIRVSNVVNAMERWGTNTTSNVNDLIAHSKTFHDYGLKKIASLQSAYISSFPENTQHISDFGLIPLKALYSINKKRTSSHDIRIDDIFKLNKKSYITDYLGYIPLFSATGSLERNQIYYSFNNVLAATGELMLSRDENVVNEFIKLCQFREFQRWQQKGTTATSNKEEEEEEVDFSVDMEEDDTVNESDYLNVFSRDFMEWRERYQEMVLPPYLLGRIMIRTYYSFPRINEKEEAQLLHRQLICFFNAVLVEEYMEKREAKGLNLANPTGSDKNFLDNLKFVVS